MPGNGFKVDNICDYRLPLCHSIYNKKKSTIAEIGKIGIGSDDPKVGETLPTSIHAGPRWPQCGRATKIFVGESLP